MAENLTVIDIITIIIAAWGAILSSFLLGWNVYRDLTNRGKLRVICRIMNKVVPGIPKDETDYLVYEVTNVGRQPIMVTQIGGRKNGKDFIITSDQIPKMLKPYEYILQETTDLSFINENLLELFAIDSSNKEHKMNKSGLKKLILYKNKLDLKKASQKIIY